MQQLNSSAAANRRPVIVLVVLLVLGMTAFMVWLASSGEEDSGESEYISNIGELQALSQQMPRYSNKAAAGDAQAFDDLLSRTNDFSRILDNVILGAEGKGLPVNIERVQKKIDQLRHTWGVMELDARVIAASKPYVFELFGRVEKVTDAIVVLQGKYEQAADMLVKHSVSVAQVALVQTQSVLLERALRNLDGIVSGKDSKAAAGAFLANADAIVRVHNRIVEGGIVGSRVAGLLAAGRSQIQALQDNVGGIYDLAPAIDRNGQLADSISVLSSQLLSDSAELSDGLDYLFAEKTYARLIAVLLVLAVIGFIVYRGRGKRLAQQSEANVNNQEAILRLLDELAGLADGDLTVTATVTEDFTGAIADSINYSIDQLRSLVVSINTTSKQVAQAANETSSTATYLSEASAGQASAITEATDSINEIVSSMDAVASNADESSKVASNSVEIANKGAGAVQNTINGMDKIREQIQKTSKQIKRLGESSQEIGDIISLINDIADQTNILSLNAAIQASMAGEAGRGFAVVADEVQRLAERSGAATKQIEVLVKAIQADTNEAVISMEQTTAEVVQGARLAQDAGVALEEIEEVSNNLAQLIQEISSAAGSQSKAAIEVASSMGMIKEISTQTSKGTEETAVSIGHLAELANDMRGSVSGFTLPAEETVRTPVAETKPEATPVAASPVSDDEVEVVLDDALEAGEEASKQGGDPAASAA